MLVVNLVIKNNTSEYNEIYSTLYSIGFFIAHPIYWYALIFLLTLPLLLLTLAILKKKKDLSIGYLICSIISVILIIIFST